MKLEHENINNMPIKQRTLTRRAVHGMCILAVIAYMTGCGGASSPEGTLPTAGVLTSSLPPDVVQSATVQVTGDKLAGVLVDEVTQPFPGVTDYQLSTIMCGGAALVYDQKVTISYPGATVLQDSANMGMSSFNQCRINSGSKFKLRLPDTITFDPAQLQVTIAGKTQSAESDVRLVKVDLYKVAGRASHPELIALNTLYPIKGDKMWVRAVLAGTTEQPRLAIKNAFNQTLFEGDMVATETGGSLFQAEITIPTEDFFVAITSANGDGDALRWVTDRYQPQAKALALDFSQNAVVTAQTRQLQAVVAGEAPASGKLVMRVSAPQGFTASWNSKTIDVKAGDPINVPIELTTNGLPPYGMQQVFLQYLVNGTNEVVSASKIMSLIEQ